MFELCKCWSVTLLLTDPFWKVRTSEWLTSFVFLAAVCAQLVFLPGRFFIHMNNLLIETTEVCLPVELWEITLKKSQSIKLSSMKSLYISKNSAAQLEKISTNNVKMKQNGQKVEISRSKTRERNLWKRGWALRGSSQSSFLSILPSFWWFFVDNHMGDFSNFSKIIRPPWTWKKRISR